MLDSTADHPGLNAALVRLQVAAPLLRPDPWLAFDWPVQVMSPSAGVFASPLASELDWARGILETQMTHPPTPWVFPKGGVTDPPVLTFCWGLNGVVNGVGLDQRLAALGYPITQSHAATVANAVRLAGSIPEFSRVLLALELLYRGISMPEQKALKAAFGEDVMKAAYQMNMVCIDPDNPDRTLLQVQRIAFKLTGSDEAVIRGGIQTQLSDGRLV